MEQQEKKSWLPLALLFTPLFFVCCFFFGSCWLSYIVPPMKMQRLLAGDGEIAIQSLTFSGQGQKIELHDLVSMQYLTLAFRSAVKEGYVPTQRGIMITYSATIKFNSSGSVRVYCYVPDDVDGLTIGFPIDGFEDPTYYWVPFLQPIPAPVSEALNQLKDRPP